MQIQSNHTYALSESVGFESKIANMVAMPKVKVISDIFKYVYIHLYAQRY